MIYKQAISVLVMSSAKRDQAAIPFAVIFDMDGVIVDNMIYHRKAWGKFFKKYDPPIALEDFVQHMGKSNEDLLSVLFGTNITEEEIRVLGEEKEALYREVYAPEVAPLTGFMDFLDSLKDNHIKTAVATAAGLADVDQHYKKLTCKYGFPIEAPEEVLFNMSFGLKREKKFQEAIKLFHTLLERFPLSVRGAFFLAETYREMGDIHSAVEMYIKTLELNPEFNAAKERLKELEKGPK